MYGRFWWPRWGWRGDGGWGEEEKRREGEEEKRGGGRRKGGGHVGVRRSTHRGRGCCWRLGSSHLFLFGLFFNNPDFYLRDNPIWTQITTIGWSGLRGRRAIKWRSACPILLRFSLSGPRGG